MYSNELVLKILEYIDNNINKKITTEELSKKFFFNKDYIMRIFKKELKVTILDYINKKRIYNSLKELKETNDLMLKIALNNGFTSQEYYSETFTKILGVNPITYRKFTKINSQITEEELNTIRSNLQNLLNFIKETDTYKKNIKTTETKKLSLFQTKS